MVLPALSLYDHNNHQHSIIFRNATFSHNCNRRQLLQPLLLVSLFLFNWPSYRWSLQVWPDPPTEDLRVQQCESIDGNRTLISWFVKPQG